MILRSIVVIVALHHLQLHLHHEIGVRLWGVPRKHVLKVVEVQLLQRGKLLGVGLQRIVVDLI